MRKRLAQPRTELPHEHDLGLAHDMSVMLSRRRALWILGAVGATSVAAAPPEPPAGGAGPGGVPPVGPPFGGRPGVGP